MSIETALYFAPMSIAERAGHVKDRYVIADGRFVLNERDLSRVRFTIDELVNGLDVEMVSKQVAQAAIKANGYLLGLNYTPSATEEETTESNVEQQEVTDTTEEVEEEPTTEVETDEVSEESTEETTETEITEETSEETTDNQEATV